jgi:competence protein ComEA
MTKERTKTMLPKNRLPLYALALLLALTSVAFAADASGTVNINSAGVEELQLLPRVGPSVAQRIVDFREDNGAFKSLDDLLLVRGIGEKTLDLLRPHIALSGATTLTEKVKVPKTTEAADDEQSSDD